MKNQEIDQDIVVTKEAPVLRFRTAYDPSYDSGDYATEVPDNPSRTKQSFKDTVDVNQILERYHRTGVFDHVNEHGGSYGDADGMEFKQALDLVNSAQDMFDDLPARARAEFDNDPAKFLDFAANLTSEDVPKLIELEMLEMGSVTHRNFVEAERRRKEFEEARELKLQEEPQGDETSQGN